MIAILYTFFAKIFLPVIQRLILPSPAESSASQTCFTVVEPILMLLIKIDVLTEYQGIAKGCPCVVPS